MITYILIGFALLVVVFLVVAAMRPDDLQVRRSITILAPVELVFAQINDPRKWMEISPYAKNDPAAQYTYTGPAEGTGASAEWAGNAKIGAGRMTIAESRPNDLVRFKFEFFKPWYCTNTTDFIFRPANPGVEVTWATFQKLNFAAKAAGLLMNMDKMMGESFEEGLVNLKNLAEAAAKK